MRNLAMGLALSVAAGLVPAAGMATQVQNPTSLPVCQSDADRNCIQARELRDQDRQPMVQGQPAAQGQRMNQGQGQGMGPAMNERPQVPPMARADGTGQGAGMGSSMRTAQGRDVNVEVDYRRTGEEVVVTQTGKRYPICQSDADDNCIQRQALRQ